MKTGIKSYTVGTYIFLLALFTLLLGGYAKEFLSYWMVITIAVIGTGITAYLAVIHLFSPLEEITNVAYEMAGGILEREIMVQGNEEIDDLANSINTIAKQLRKNINRFDEERNRAKTILDSMDEGVIALDNEGRVILLNTNLKEIYKHSEKEVIGKKLIEVIRNFELDKLIRQVLQEKRAIAREIKLFLPNPRTYKVHATPLKGSKKGENGVVALMRDITDRWEYDKMRTEFVANVSHELRTPLTSIKGFVETLLDGAMDDRDTAIHFLSIINKETNRLNRLIDDLLKLSTLENQNKRLDLQPVHLNEIIQQVVEVFNHQAAIKNISLTTLIENNLPVVWGEKDLLVQVLVNLVDNAIKYTPKDGQVEVLAKDQKEQLKIIVKDTGGGIPEESIPRLFERFYRVDKARSREEGGTGLGLAIAKHVVELHGGKIKVDTSFKGTEFSFTLPVTTMKPSLTKS